MQVDDEDVRLRSSSSRSFTNINDDPLVDRGVRLLERWYDLANLANWRLLLDVWLAHGINLALGGPFLQDCIATVESQLMSQSAVDCSRRLLRNSKTGLTIDETSNIQSFSDHLHGDSIRWETLGLLLTAIGRASIDLAHFPLVYKTGGQHNRIRQAAAALSDDCLDLCLSLDCLNDLQLILQYENFILRSYVDGDQSQ